MANWRAWPTDGKLLMFDRDTGCNQLLSGEETAHLVQKAPRSIQLALTNACDKSCSFCYRPEKARSMWTFDEVLDFCHFCEDWGVLEIAFGGGEPTLFPRLPELLKRIWTETKICSNLTTHGLNLTDKFLQEIHGHYGQIQVSVYDEDPTLEIIELLVRNQSRFGLNYLVTPARARTLEVDIHQFVNAGVRDFLLLSYKGNDTSMHLSPREVAMFDESLSRLHERYKSRVGFKVDVCWGNRLKKTPQLLYDGGDCLAGNDSISISSNKKILPCSFHGDGGTPFHSHQELRELYQSARLHQVPIDDAGCARRPGHGLAQAPTQLVNISSGPHTQARR